MNRDFCDLCGLEASDKEKGGQGPLIGCKKCDHAYHTFCAGETEDLFKNNGHWCWECPECKGTAAEVFAWGRLIVPMEKEDAAEGIFVEHNKTVAVVLEAVVLEDGVGSDTGGGGGPRRNPLHGAKRARGAVDRQEGAAIRLTKQLLLLAGLRQRAQCTKMMMTSLMKTRPKRNFGDGRARPRRMPPKTSRQRTDAEGEAWVLGRAKVMGVTRRTRRRAK